jgi:hypothetical protein
MRRIRHAARDEASAAALANEAANAVTDEELAGGVYTEVHYPMRNT